MPAKAKIARVIRCLRIAPDTMVAIDSEESARRLSEAGLAYGVDIPFWYDAPDEDTYELVDVDFHGNRKPVSEHVIDLVDEVTVIGSRCGPFEPALQALSDGSVQMTEMISGVFPMEQALEAFELASQPETLKVLLKM